jgi:hypothetical protein
MFLLESSQAFLLAAITLLQASGHDCLASLPCVLGWAIRVCVCVCVCTKYTQKRQRQCYSASQPCVIDEREREIERFAMSTRRHVAQLLYCPVLPTTACFLGIVLAVHVVCNTLDCVWALLSCRRCCSACRQRNFVFMFVRESHEERERDGKLLWGPAGSYTDNVV